MSSEVPIFGQERRAFSLGEPSWTPSRCFCAAQTKSDSKTPAKKPTPALAAPQRLAHAPLSPEEPHALALVPEHVAKRPPAAVLALILAGRPGHQVRRLV